MRSLLCCVYLALCLTCSKALPLNQGTGRNCITASDAPGGPKCTGSPIGLCCDASFHSDNCLTLLGATAANADKPPPAGSLPSCSSFNSSTAEPLSSYCCDEMDAYASDCVPGASPLQAECTAPANIFCCAHGGNGTNGSAVNQALLALSMACARCVVMH
ncbi:TPA: hypothetical protein ACH3X2_005489 [Trebouxia sp. C0005]